MGTLINVMFECQFLLIHLCYYVIAHYIKLVALYLGEEEELETFGNEYIFYSVIINSYSK